jgi:hypothetical protein
MNKEKVIINSNILAMYVDITIRGLVSFMIFGSFSYFILIKMFNLPIWLILPIIFVGSVLLSPLLSKINLGHKVQEKYDNFLREVIKYMRR